MNKKIIGLVSALALLAGPIPAFGAGNTPNVNWGDGKGTHPNEFTISLDAEQQRFWESNGAGGNKGNGPALVEAWANSVGQQNGILKKTIEKKPIENPNVPPTKFTCISNVSSHTTTDSFGNSETYYNWDEIYKEEYQEEGWTKKNLSCPATLDELKHVTDNNDGNAHPSGTKWEIKTTQLDPEKDKDKIKKYDGQEGLVESSHEEERPNIGKDGKVDPKKPVNKVEEKQLAPLVKGGKEKPKATSSPKPTKKECWVETGAGKKKVDCGSIETGQTQSLKTKPDPGCGPNQYFDSVSGTCMFRDLNALLRSADTPLAKSLRGENPYIEPPSKPTTQPTQLPSGTQIQGGTVKPGENKPGEFAGNAEWHKQRRDVGTGHGSGTSVPAQDPRCGISNAAFNAKEKANPKPLDKQPFGNEVDQSKRMTTSYPIRQGCVYYNPGLKGQVSKLTGSGGMHCLRGWSYGQQFDDSLSAPEGNPVNFTLAGTKWDDLGGRATMVKKSPYGESESWESCAPGLSNFLVDEKAAKEINASNVANPAEKGILPVGLLGRYFNGLFIYRDNPTVEITDMAKDGTPANIKIIEHDYSVIKVPIELQQACQTGFAKDEYTPAEARATDLKAFTFTHYEINGRIPAQYRDVRVTAVKDPSNSPSLDDAANKTPLSYTLTDCIYKPGVVREDSAYMCGSGQRPSDAENVKETEYERGEGPSTSTTTSSIVSLEKEWTDAQKEPLRANISKDGSSIQYKDIDNATLDTMGGNGQAKNTALVNGTLDLNRNGEPLYLRWNKPTVLVDSSHKAADSISNLRIDKTLSLTERYKTQGANELNNGTPFVSTPPAKGLALDGKYDPAKFKDSVTENGTLSNFAPDKEYNGYVGKPYVYPMVGDSLVGAPATEAAPKVKTLKQAKDLDFRIHSPKTGDVLNMMTIAGTQNKKFMQGYDANGAKVTTMVARGVNAPTATSVQVSAPAGSGYITELDNLYNSYDMGKTQLASGISSVWNSEEGRPQYLSAASRISGVFPMRVVKFETGKSNGMGKVTFKFSDDQIEKKVKGQLMCISDPTKVNSLKSAS